MMLKNMETNTDTFGNTAKSVGGLNMPNMEKLGLGNLHEVMGVSTVDEPAYYQRLKKHQTVKIQ